MAEHRLSNGLSPALEAVLSSLNVNLEAELNRYRRTRHVHNVPEDDIFADLDAVIEDSSNLDFDLTAAPSSIAVSTVTIPSLETIPPPPPNRKLNKKLPASPSHSQSAEVQAGDHVSALTGMLATTQSHADKRLADSPEIAFQRLAAETLDSSAALVQSPADSGYLASSEKLIESLSEVPSMPEPVNLTPKPKRKTVSLIAGAGLGLLALVSGLGASYVMSNPDVAQRLAGGFKGESATLSPLPERTFDPPGPDLSAQEFVDLKLDNLSSLNMQASLDPLATAATPVPSALPPIESTAPPLPQATLPQATLPSPSVTASQSLSIPAGTNYYVTVPFSTEQGLIEIRKAVEEAFVRQFSDGNRIQLAVFDNLETAQSFIAKLQTQGVQAQVYGPTAE